MKKIALLSLLALGVNAANAGLISFANQEAAAPRQFDVAAVLNQKLSEKDLPLSIKRNAYNVMDKEQSETSQLAKELSLIEQINEEYTKLSSFLKEDKEISELNELQKEYLKAKGKKKNNIKKKMRKLFAVKGKENKKEFKKLFNSFLKNTNLVSKIGINSLKSKIEKTLKDLKMQRFSSENEIAQLYIQNLSNEYTKLLEKVNKMNPEFFESEEASKEYKSLLAGLDLDILFSEYPESNLKPEEITALQKEKSGIKLTSEEKAQAKELQTKHTHHRQLSNDVQLIKIDLKSEEEEKAAEGKALETAKEKTKEAEEEVETAEKEVKIAEEKSKLASEEAEKAAKAAKEAEEELKAKAAEEELKAAEAAEGAEAALAALAEVKSELEQAEQELKETEKAQLKAQKAAEKAAEKAKRAGVELEEKRTKAQELKQNCEKRLEKFNQLDNKVSDLNEKIAHKEIELRKIDAIIKLNNGADLLNKYNRFVTIEETLRNDSNFKEQKKMLSLLN